MRLERGSELVLREMLFTVQDVTEENGYTEITGTDVYGNDVYLCMQNRWKCQIDRNVVDKRFVMEQL